VANDLDEAEQVLRDHAGVDNDDIGRVLSRLVRTARRIIGRLADIEARLTVLEQAAAVPPAPAPPE
jgi:hypothetical protein